MFCHNSKMTMNLYTAKIVFNDEANPNCPDILLDVTLQCGGYTYISDGSYGGQHNFSICCADLSTLVYIRAFLFVPNAIWTV